MSQIEISAVSHSSLMKTSLKVCTRCIYDERVSAITFDEEGVCNYCHQIDQLEAHCCLGKGQGEIDGSDKGFGEVIAFFSNLARNSAMANGALLLM